MAPSNLEAPRKKTGFATASLVLGLLSLPTVGILLVGALLAIVFGVVGLVKANRAPAEYGGKGRAIAGIAAAVFSVVVAPFFIGIFAAIAIPSLLRARVSANEAAAIGDVRTVVSAELAFSSSNGGLYGPLSCLEQPSTCIPSHKGGPFLDRSIASLQDKQGYKRRFVSDADPTEGDDASPQAGPRGYSQFAYYAMPLTQNRTGVRSFCGDASGRVCQMIGEGSSAGEREMPPACPSDCKDLR